MKILMLTSRYGFGYGMGYSAYKEAAALSDFGNTVTVLHCYNSPEIAMFSDPRISTIYLPIKKIPLVGFFIYFFKIRRFFKNQLGLKKFDLIYIQSLEFGLIDMEEIKIPIFYFARSTMIGLQKTLRGEGIKQPFLNNITHLILVCLEKRCMRFSKKVFVKSQIMASEVADLYQVNPSKIATIIGGIDENDFNVSTKIKDEEVRKKLSIPASYKVVLYAGRIVPQKGLVYLVLAALRLLTNYKFVIVIAGSYVDKDYVASIMKILNNNPFEKSFYFLGHVDQLEMSSIFNIADCVVTPSLYEPFGMVNLQAAFLGKIVITSAATGSVDLLKDYPGLIVTQSRSSKALERSLLEFFKLPKNNCNYIFNFSQYSWTKVAEQILTYFNLP